MNDVLLKPQDLTEEQLNVTELKHQLTLFGDAQKVAFLAHAPVNDLVYQRAEFMDALLQRLWQHYAFNHNPNLALIAVGGYGRSELHPLSDIDLLILSESGIEKQYETRLSEFVTLLWDLKLEVGHSVRTLSECLDVGLNDLTVATNLQEARLLCGSERIFHQLKNCIHSEHFWPSDKFFQAKVQEQRDRHARYHDTAYNLEPDIKSSPGGLRDIHTLSWIARRHFGATSLREMSKYGFLTDAEFRELDECQTMLWRIRFALHLELRRYDNRLTFSHQPSVAETLEYKGEGNRGIELMMKDFYRTLGRVSELNKMLIRLFAQAIEDEPDHKKIEVLSDDFQRRGRQIEARKPALFQARPDTIIDMFLHIANDKSIESISAPTLRQLRTARRRLNRFLCDIPEAKEKFIELTRHPNALHKAFLLMHKHGVLSAYLPQWSQIVGQMQFDLFHAYTVDEHTVRLLKHINGFSNTENRETHPICCDIYPRLAKPELLLLAAIFHDIGKGRGGDHSEIGAEESYTFCIEHGFSRPEANLVSWLVKNHLLMSVTAQRRDIYDPDVITEFAKSVRDEERLDYLICLTVADINATNPELWNSWKRTLLAELYYSTQKALRRGLENPPDIRERIRHNQQLASALLRMNGHPPREIELLWQRFKADYFLRHTHKQIAWHSENILAHDSDEPLVLVSKNATRGGTELFVYSQDRPSLFARVVASLDKKNLSVHDAQIMTSKDGFALDTFMVLDANNEAISSDRHTKIKEGVTHALMQEGTITLPCRRASRKLMAFNVKTQVNFLPTRTGRRTLIELVALDTPGLLARVGAILAREKVSLQAAKITTIGERAEDFFIVTDTERQSLSEEQQTSLREALFDAINDAS
ncbi:[protein-PII] uridylyltransferase [Enterovibrio norvegicus]|uniref:bifunctional uridylyltransferase/uridylyl-removing protein GlnD n=1 Tax=Enterovibrio norvegicus TaxID=188144 RepID=UPI00030EC13C|nr:bifunctional uridylyltransferase/uridylyl-removing protein GlnD [Enterovibrio norvegicus]MCC4799318.1 bifunctional uridylyltransferase/uridylyl-removing protein GlnD [Enterovibrio norvegicus]OEE68598.1 [protein-PII] uridylyltransferase [Enterovibrio norvegicus]OEF51265.1 [protein-PII] uridylyltransferase [Enterovibrio norvegicus]PMI34937.1 [protein-PII] uridylyltransferase [Enterovibrio norvegicus]PMI35602.1 [protein-PII] uridylyltransferase [Enterovibrio norvegicus]